MGSLCESSYENFEPNMEWKHEDQVDTLIVHLPGFRKQQLKVQVTISGDLRITGARRIKCTKRYRFVKEFPISSNNDRDKITASYHGGKLYVKLPKLIVPQEETQPSSKWAPNRGNKPQSEGISEMTKDNRKDFKRDGVESSTPGSRKPLDKTQKPEGIRIPGEKIDTQRSRKPDGSQSSKSGSQKSLGRIGKPEDNAESITTTDELRNLKPDDISTTQKPDDTGHSDQEPVDTGVTEKPSGILSGNGKSKTKKLKEVCNGVIMEFKKPENRVKGAMLVLLALGLGLYSLKKSFKSFASLDYVFRCQESTKDWWWY